MGLKGLSIIVALSLLLTACTASTLTAEEALEMIESAQGYNSEAKMAVKNNKSIFYYNLKQYYKQGKFRIEFYDDYGKLKQTLIYNNGQCGIYHANIDKPFKTENFVNGKEHISFVSVFVDYYRKDPEAKWVKRKVKEEEYYAFTCRVDNPTSFFQKAELIVSIKSGKPKMLYIFGDENSKTMEVMYKVFEYNDSIDDSLFNMKSD